MSNSPILPGLMPPPGVFAFQNYDPKGVMKAQSMFQAAQIQHIQASVAKAQFEANLVANKEEEKPVNQKSELQYQIKQGSSGTWIISQKKEQVGVINNCLFWSSYSRSPTNTFFRKRVKRKKQNTQRRQHQRKIIPVIYLILLQLTKIFIFQLIILYFNSNQINKLFNKCNRFTLAFGCQHGTGSHPTRCRLHPYHLCS